MQTAVGFVFLGRAWQHWFYEAPYRELLWDEGRMKWLVENVFGVEWTLWVTDEVYDIGINTFIDGLGIFYLVCAVAVLTINKFPRISRLILIIGAVSLILLAGLYFKQKSYAIGQFFEYSLQFMGSIILVLMAKTKALTKRLILILKIVIALTFLSHGLYAVGYYPISVGFIEMCINILPITEEQALIFLHTAGALDFIICILIFLPYRKATLLGFAYASLWGLATALARPVGYFHIEFWQESLHRWMFEAMFRFIHGLGPMVLFFYYWREGKEKSLVSSKTKKGSISE